MDTAAIVIEFEVMYGLLKAKAEEGNPEAMQQALAVLGTLYSIKKMDDKA